MFDPITEFRTELTAVAEREWEQLTETQRNEILEDYDLLANTDGLEWAIFAEQWRRERGR